MKVLPVEISGGNNVLHHLDMSAVKELIHSASADAIASISDLPSSADELRALINVIANRTV